MIHSETTKKRACPIKLSTCSGRSPVIMHFLTPLTPGWLRIFLIRAMKFSTSLNSFPAIQICTSQQWEKFGYRNYCIRLRFYDKMMLEKYHLQLLLKKRASSFNMHTWKQLRAPYFQGRSVRPHRKHWLRLQISEKEILEYQKIWVYKFAIFDSRRTKGMPAIAVELRLPENKLLPNLV